MSEWTPEETSLARKHWLKGDLGVGEIAALVKKSRFEVTRKMTDMKVAQSYEQPRIIDKERDGHFVGLLRKAGGHGWRELRQTLDGRKALWVQPYGRQVAA
jgi:hypothetical protein